jgi:hypothetical protein
MLSPCAGYRVGTYILVSLFKTPFDPEDPCSPTIHTPQLPILAPAEPAVNVGLTNTIS